jgi:hypothetical protein
MGSLYRSQHELILVWLNGTGTHVNNVELGRHGRSRSNVWTYPGVNTFRRGRNDELRMHPTVKPVDLVADAIKDCSLRGAIVLDPFLGSGTSLIAAEKTGRKARGLEIDPRYVDVAEEFFTPDKNCYVEPKKSIPRRRPRAKQDVGYRRPPIESRWKPGQSGNPSGRPKGSKNLRSAIEEMLTEKITVTEGNKIRRVTRLEAVLLKQLSLALKGDLKAIQAVYTSANTLGMLEVRPDKIVVRNLSPLTDDELLELERLLVKAGGGIEPG